MLVPFSKSANAMISSNQEVKDSTGRPWLFQFGNKPALVANLPDGEIHVKKLATDSRPRGFGVAFFPDIEFREIVQEKPKPKVEAKKPFTTERRKIRAKN